MKTSKNILSILLFSISILILVSCENSADDISTELTIQEKVQLLENNKWLLKDFEDRVMHAFKDGKQLTYYGTDNVFSDEAIPGTQSYIIEGNQLTIDYNFGNLKTFDLKVSCNANIIEFYENGELNKTLYRRNSNYKDCL